MHRNRYLIAFLLVLLLSSVYVFVFSKSGLLERYMLESRETELLKKNEALKKENHSLRKRLDSLASGSVDQKDFSTYGALKPGSKVAIVKGINDARTPDIEPLDYEAKELPLTHMRIIWVVVSLLVLFLYFNRIYRTVETSDDVL